MTKRKKRNKIKEVLKKITLFMLPLLIVFLAALVFSRAFHRFHLPWAVALIIAGILLGTSGFEVLEIDHTIAFLAQIGLIFLMFMAGMETEISGIRDVWKKSLTIALITGLIPLIVGLIIGWLFGLKTATTILLGIIFTSSSVAVVIPSLEAKGMLHSRIGKVIISSTMFQDIASLILLAVMLQYLAPETFLPFSIFIVLFPLALIGGFFLAKWMPHLKWLFGIDKRIGPDFFEKELRFSFLILIGVVLIFEALGVHSIAGAFFAGLILAETLNNKQVKNKIHVLAYGFFIPVFFVVVGAQTNFEVFLETKGIAFLAVVVLIGSIGAKFLSGWGSSRLLGYDNTRSSLIGATCIPQLSTTLAVVFMGQELGFLTPEIVAVLVLLSIVTVIISPIISNNLLDKIIKEKLIDIKNENNTKK